jgi:hypothetical protein
MEWTMLVNRLSRVLQANICPVQQGEALIAALNADPDQEAAVVPVLGFCAPD